MLTWKLPKGKKRLLNQSKNFQLITRSGPNNRKKELRLLYPKSKRKMKKSKNPKKKRRRNRKNNKIKWLASLIISILADNSRPLIYSHHLLWPRSTTLSSKSRIKYHSSPSQLKKKSKHIRKKLKKNLMPNMDSVQKKAGKDIKLKIRKIMNKLNKKSKLKKRKRRKGLLNTKRNKLSAQNNSLV